MPRHTVKNIVIYMWYELVIMIGADLVVLIAITAMNLNSRRMGVLSGRYFAAKTDWVTGRPRTQAAAARPPSTMTREIDSAYECECHRCVLS